MGIRLSDYIKDPEKALSDEDWECIAKFLEEFEDKCCQECDSKIDNNDYGLTRTNVHNGTGFICRECIDSMEDVE